MALTINENKIKSSVNGAATLDVAEGTITAAIPPAEGYVLKGKIELFKNMTAEKVKSYNDSFEVTIKDDTKTGDKQLVTLSGGRVTQDNAGDGSVTISGLKEGKPVNIQFKGQLKIGPPGDDNNAATLNVSIGNWNSDRDWIIDMSDKGGASGGSSLNVSGLLKWIEGNTADKDGKSKEVKLAIPGGDAGAADQLKNFIIDFNAFRFNVTRGLYNIDIQTRGDAKLRLFNNFEISNVALQITNMDLKTLQQPKEDESKAISK